MSTISLKNYKAIPVLDDFPNHKAMFKWIYGGVGGSKSYTLSHQAILLSMWFPGNFGVVGRKVEHIMEATIQRELVGLCHEYKLVKSWEKTAKLLTLINESQIKFLPLNLPITEYGSINAGFIIIDEASEVKENRVKYLFTRLRKDKDLAGKKIKREMCLGSTWEGHNYLWRMFLRDNKENGLFKSWRVRTRDNSYLPADYEDILRMVHSEEWCRRYLDCEETSFAGLVYDMFNDEFHVVPDYLHDFDEGGCEKRLIIDPGPHATAFVVLLFDELHNIIYCVHASKFPYIGVPEISRQIDLLMERHKVDRFQCLIDPAAQSKEQTSKSSVRHELRKELGFLIKYANKNKSVGIEKIKRRLLIRTDQNHDGWGNKGEAGLYLLKGAAKPLSDEMLEYVWADTTLDEFDYVKKEEPKKQKDDCVDCLRYGVLDLDNHAYRKKKYSGTEFDPRLKMPYYQALIKKHRLGDRLPAAYHEYMAGLLKNPVKTQ